MKTILRWVLVVLVAVGGGGYLWLRAGLPQTAGTLTVEGIGAPIEIVRDTDGVPHILAASDADALYGLGYVHAQDRLWQMEFQRRIGNGQLSEVFGPATLDIDKFLRTVGLARAAHSAWEKTSPATRALIQAYVDGINAYIGSHHGRQLPLEFTMLGFEPQLWQPEDTFVWLKMMAWSSGGNWSDELLRSRLVAQLGAPRTAQLMPAYPADGPMILSQEPGAKSQKPGASDQSAASALGSQFSAVESSLFAINRALQQSLGLGGHALGSTNWVVSGARTTTGAPLLANDSQLDAQMPSSWYLAHVTGEHFDVVGATLPGLPGVVIGHNKRIAWGITNTGFDVQDLYIEHINARDQAEHNGAWEPLQVFKETIKVKGEPDVPLTVRVSRHGPLLSDLVPTAQQSAIASRQPSDALALRWTALDDEDTTIEAFLKLNSARTWGEFTGALTSYRAPMQNFVYADVEGSIGYYAPGALPIRVKGDGTLPVPGWNDEYGWSGYVPFKELPNTKNPTQGYIVSANNKVAPDSDKHSITGSYAAPYRAERIIELISAKPKLSPDDMAAMQADVRSTQSRKLLPLLLNATPTDDRSRTALELLRSWDGTISADSVPAAIYEAWLAQLGAQMFKDELGDVLWNDYADNDDAVALALFNALRDPASAWCDDVGTPQREDCATTLGLALRNGLATMSAAQGSDDLHSWRWDKVHVTLFPHRPFDNVAVLKALFSRSVPRGGDAFTVNVATVDPAQGYTNTHVSSYRQIIDMQDWPNSRFMNTIGQSGNIFSGHYSDLLARWQAVAYIPMRFRTPAINAAAQSRLVLVPAGQ